MTCFLRHGPTRGYVARNPGRLDRDERPSIFVRDKPIFSLERLLHKDYYRRSSAEKKCLVVGLKGLDAKTN
jgi:hypothetical protein